VAPSDAKEKNRNIGAQQQSILYTTAQKRFGKIYFLYEFWCAQSGSFRAVFGLQIRNLTLAVSAMYQHAEKKLYRCTSTVSAVNYCSRIFFKSLSYLYEVVRTTLPPIFWIFAIFDRNFAKSVAPPSDINENYVVHLKEQSLLKKRCKPRRNRTINGNGMLVRTMHSSNARCCRLGA